MAISCLCPFYAISIFPLVNQKIFHLLVKLTRLLRDYPLYVRMYSEFNLLGAWFIMCCVVSEYTDVGTCEG